MLNDCKITFYRYLKIKLLIIIIENYNNPRVFFSQFTKYSKII